MATKSAMRDVILCGLCGTYPSKWASYYDVSNDSIVYAITCHGAEHRVAIPKKTMLSIGVSLAEHVQAEFNRIAKEWARIRPEYANQNSAPVKEETLMVEKQLRKIDLE